MRPNEAEEVVWGQILQGLVRPVKDFGPYSVSNGMDAMKCCKQEREKSIKQTFIFKILARILWRINGVEPWCK